MICGTGVCPLTRVVAATTDPERTQKGHMRGIYADVRHAVTCPLHTAGAIARRTPFAKNSRRRVCNCEPVVRVRLSHGGDWWSSDRLSREWTASDLQPLIDKAAAERRAIDSGVKAAATPQRAKPVPTVAEWGEELLRRWGVEIETEYEYRLEESTFILYRGRIRKHIAPPRSAGGIGDLLLTAVTPDVLRDLKHRLMTVKAMQESSAYNVITLLSRMFNEALGEASKNGWPLESNPTKVVEQRGRKKGQRHSRHSLGDGDGKAMPLDVARLLLRKHQGTPFGELLWMAMTTGMREAEIAGLKRSSLKLARRRLYVENQLGRGRTVMAIDKPPKYDSYRWVPIYSKLAATLMPYDGGDGYVFIDWHQRALGGPWQVRKMTVTLSASWDQLVAEHPELPPRGERQGWHSCRHLYSNLLDRGGVRQAVRKYVLGHHEKGMNAVYLEVNDVDLNTIEPVLDAAFGDLLGAAVTAPTVVR